MSVCRTKSLQVLTISVALIISISASITSRTDSDSEEATMKVDHLITMIISIKSKLNFKVKVNVK